jgi:hypothetical protein
MANNIILPLNIAAMRVSNSDQDGVVTSATVNYDNREGKDPQDWLYPLTSGQTKLGVGVHLHWALPNVFNIANMEEETEKESIFHTIPNRWLVVRMLRDMSDFSSLETEDKKSLNVQTYNTDMWLVQSDAVHNKSDIGVPIVDFEKADSLKLINKRIGHKEKLKQVGAGFQYKKTEFAEQESLFSMSYYGMTFAVYYQNSKNVLGIEDNLCDLYGKLDSNGKAYIPEQVKKCLHCKVSYGVIGWHDGGEDYFNSVLVKEIKKWGPLSEEEFQDKLKSLLQDKSNTILPDDGYKTITSSNYQEVRTICCGVVSQLDYNLGQKLSTNTTFRPERPALKMSLGNTTIESMSAYLASPQSLLTSGIDPKLEANIEKLYSALMSGKLRQLDTRNGFGLAQLEEYLHSETFRPIRGGQAWFIKPQPREGENTNSHAAMKSDVLPVSVASMLAKLNQSQNEFDRATADVHGAQHQIYLSWHKAIEAINSLDIANKAKSNSSRYVLSGLYNYLFPKMIETGQIVTEEESRAVSFKDFEYLIKDKPLQLPKMEGHLEDNIKALIKLQLGIQYGRDLAGGVVEECSAVNATTIVLASKLAQLTGLLQLLSSLTDGAGQKNLLEILKINVEESCSKLAGYKSKSVDLDDLYDFDATDAIASLGYVGNERGYSGSNYFLNMAPGILYARTLEFWVDTEDPIVDAGKYSLLKKPLAWVTEVEAAAEAILHAEKGVPFALNAFHSFNAKSAILLKYLNNLKPTGNDIQLDPQFMLPVAEKIAALFNEFEDLATALESIVDKVLGQWPIGQQVVFRHKALQESLWAASDQLALVNIPDDTYFAPHDPVITMVETVESKKQPILAPFQRNSNAPFTYARTSSNLLKGVKIDPDLNLSLSDGLPPFSADINTLLGEVAILGNFHQKILDNTHYQNSCEEFFTYIDKYRKRQKDHFNPDPGTAPMARRLLGASDMEGGSIYEKGADNLKSIAGLVGTLPFYTGVELLKESDGNPFYPLFMIYEVEMRGEKLYDASGYNANVLIDKYKLSEADERLEGEILFHSDMQYMGSPVLEKEKTSFYNYIMLSRSSNFSLLHQLEKYIKDNEGNLKSETAEQLRATWQKISNKLFLSQVLSGFHDNFLQQLQTLQLPINHNIQPGLIKQDVSSTLRINAASWETYNGDWNANIPVPNGHDSPFQPIRAGFASIRHVYLVDSFGQYFDFEPNRDMVIAKDLQATITVPPEAKDLPVQFPPRFVEPLRIKYSWVSAQKPAGGDYFEMVGRSPEHSPIVGWLTPNHLDGSIAVYNSDGYPIEYWRTFEKEMKGYSIPGKQYAMNQVLQILKDRMKALQQKMGSGHGKGFLEKFMAAAETAQKFSIPLHSSQERSLAVYMGRSMAVVRVRLRLERQGHGALRLTKTTPSGTSPLPDFLNPADGKSTQTPMTEIYSPAHFQTPDYSSVKVPLLLGNMPQFNDGLVGYFIERKGANGNGDFDLDGSPFITDAIEPSETIPGVLERHDSKRIALSLQNSETSEVSLLMLIEPRSPIHVATGILPTIEIKLAPNLYDAAINRMAMYFLVAPVLTSYHPKDDHIPTMTLPISNIQNFSWHWLEKSQPKRDGQHEAEPALMQVKNQQQLMQPGMPDPDGPMAEPMLVDGWLRLDRENPEIDLLDFRAKKSGGGTYENQVTVKAGEGVSLDLQLTIAQNDTAILLDEEFELLLHLGEGLKDLSIQDGNWEKTADGTGQYKWKGAAQKMEAVDAYFELKSVRFTTAEAIDFGHAEINIILSRSHTLLNGQPQLMVIKPLEIKVE